LPVLFCEIRLSFVLDELNISVDKKDVLK
jgi:hypothetical protein